MLRAVLTFVMITLIALQSLASVADVHGLHQSGNQHLSVEHSHAAATGISEHPNESSNGGDCQHCCHCHGTVHFFLNTDLSVQCPQQLTADQTDYHISYTSYRPSLDNPPPIS